MSVHLPDVYSVLPNIGMYSWCGTARDALSWRVSSVDMALAGRPAAPSHSLPACKADLQLLLSSTSMCPRWEMAGIGKHEASDPFGLFFQLCAGSSTVPDILVQGMGICCGMAPFPNSRTGSCPASQQLIPRPWRAPDQPGEPWGARLCSLPLLSADCRQILQNYTVKPDGALTEQANMATDQICTLMDYTQP